MSLNAQRALQRGFGWVGRPQEAVQEDRLPGVFSGAEGAASSSLEESTLKDRLRFPEVTDDACYRVKLKDYGEGRVVCSGVFQEKGWRGARRGVRRSATKRTVSSSRSISLDPRSVFIAAERSEFARRRAKSSVRDKIWMLRADRMLTLTKRGKFASVDDAWDAWHAFARLARKFWGSRWKFVIVPEAHKTGGYHLHVALNGFFDVGMLRRLWSRALGGTGRESGADTFGNIDITGAVASPRSRTRIASYLGKYLAKDALALLGGRRAFASSRGIPAPRVVRWNQALTLLDSAIGIAQRKIREFVDARLVALIPWSYHWGGLKGFIISPLE